MGWFGLAWLWLGENSKEFSAVSSIVFGVSSAAVAWVALRLNYFSSRGAKPLLHMASLGFSRAPKTDEEFNTFKCEVWNRRKYPIRLKLVTARMRDVDFKELLERKDCFHGGWILFSRGDFIQQLDVEVDAGKHFTIEGKFPVIRAKWRNWPWLRVLYFDPVAGGPRSVTISRTQRWRWWKADTIRGLRNAIRPVPDWIPVKVVSHTKPKNVGT